MTNVMKTRLGILAFQFKLTFLLYSRNYLLLVINVQKSSTVFCSSLNGTVFHEDASGILAFKFKLTFLLYLRNYLLTVINVHKFLALFCGSLNGTVFQQLLL
jgi:hypothetical protein